MNVGICDFHGTGLCCTGPMTSLCNVNGDCNASCDCSETPSPILPNCTSTDGLNCLDDGSYVTVDIPVVIINLTTIEGNLQISTGTVLIVTQDLTIGGNLIIGPGATLHPQSTTIISGSLLMSGNSTIQFESTTPPIQVMGCVDISGNLNVHLSGSGTFTVPYSVVTCRVSTALSTSSTPSSMTPAPPL